MRKITLLSIISLVLVLFSCKKDQVSPNTDTQKLIPMTLTIGDGEKTEFDTNGGISWKRGDHVNVVAKGKCIGRLNNSNENQSLNRFAGGIKVAYLELGDDYEDVDFYYYYVGGHEINDETTAYDMSFGVQSGDLDHLGDYHVLYGEQKIRVSKDTKSIVASTTMKSYTSVAHIDLRDFAKYGETDEALYMYGDQVYDKLTIDFSDNTFETKQTTNKYFPLGTSEGKQIYWTFLPTGENSEVKVHFFNKRTNGELTFKNGIGQNKWYCSGGDATAAIGVVAEEYCKGSLRGKFTINDAGDKVQFSQGNLYYKSDVWNFEKYQYDYRTYNAGSDEWGLFGWSTNDYTPNWYGKSTSQTAGDYDGEFVDWGSISTLPGNGGTFTVWRTLTSAEWNYLLNGRGGGLADYPRFAKARVDKEKLNGLIIFPDDYEYVTVGEGIADFNSASATYPTVSIPDETWKLMEQLGVVFLPAAGRRDGTAVSQANVVGLYWSSILTSSDNPSFLSFYSTNMVMYDATKRYLGESVRLVKDVQAPASED